MRNLIKLPLGRLCLASLASVLLLPGVTAQAQSSITNGLVAYWNFDGKNFTDSIGHFDGTQNGANPITFVGGKTDFGQAIQLDGVDQMVEITGGEPDDLAFEGGSMSIAGWFKVGAFDKSWQALVAKGEGSNWRVARNSASGTMSYAGGLTDATGATDVSDGNWHHLVAISDASGANFGTAIYIDGVQDGTISGTAALVANGSRMIIGDNPGSRGRYWNGAIDDLAIWNRVLTEAEISALYAGGTGKPLVSFYTTQLDTDKDGMPDAWETKYGLNPNDPSDAAKDANGNGLSNLEEFKRDLNPLDTTKPTIESAAANGNFDTVVVTFSKPLDVATAMNMANYAISPSLPITDVALKLNVVTLTTAKQTPGATPYTVTVNNVKDINNWPVAPGTKVIFYSYLLVKTGINSGLQAYWNFDGKNFADSANHFDGTESGSSPIAFAAGKTGFGQAMQLDGVDQYVQITGGNPDDLAFAGRSMSIAGWFKVGAFDKSWQALVAKGEGSNWRVARNNADVGLSYAGGLTDAIGTKDVTDGNWHHFAAISDATGLNFGTALYIDGARDGVIAGKAILAANGSRMMIGENPGATGRSWNGAIDDLAIWSRVLSEAEIASLYANGTGKPVSALAAVSTDLPAAPEGEFLTQTPAPNAKNVLPTTDITIVHTDGKSPWTAADVTLKLDGATVTPTFVKQESKATITFKPSALLAGATTHTITIGHLDPGGQPATTEWSFTTIGYNGVVKDKVKSYTGLILGSAQYTADTKGVTGKAGDYGKDLTKTGGPVQVVDADFLTAVNAAFAKDELSVSIWVKRYDIADSSAIWFSSPTQARAFQAHTPWSDSVIYFDTGGTAATCCDVSGNRISAGIDTFPAYTGDISWWTNNWHLFVFTKKADQKNIFIDGTLFLGGSSSAVLATDINQFNIGADNTTTAGRMHAIVDDVAVYSKELSMADVTALKGGTLPSALPTTVGLLAYWDFNTPVITPVDPQLKATAQAGKIVVTWASGTLVSSPTVKGTYAPVSGATSPYTVTPTTGAMFYQIQQ